MAREDVGLVLACLGLLVHELEGRLDEDEGSVAREDTS